MLGVKLHIPRLGDKIVLAEPWSFTLWAESRNGPLIGWLGLPTDWESLKPLLTDADKYWASRFTKPVTLPAGTELTIRRLYMRQGARDFDSMTFTAALTERKTLAAAFKKKPKPKAVRFWAKLDDVNNMQVVHAGGIVSPVPQREIWWEKDKSETYMPLPNGSTIPVVIGQNPAAAWPFKVNAP